MVCHLVKAETNLGRSTVIDLLSTHENKFRQIDHRTIEFIIINNTKYELKKGGKKVDANEDDDDKKKDEPKWDFKKLAIGDTFSGTSYYKTSDVSSNEVVTRCQGKDISVSKDILEHEMHNASVFAEEEKITITRMAEILQEANTTCFTVCFSLKVDEALVKERLAKCTQAELKEGRALAKERLSGKESTLVARLSKADGKLGRSLVIDLPT